MITHGRQQILPPNMIIGRTQIQVSCIGREVVFGSLWLSASAQAAILGAFGQTDGMAVINATNAYLNGIAAQGQAGKDKATALAGFINEDPIPYATMIYNGYLPILGISFDGASWLDTGLLSTDAQSYDCVLSNVAGRGTTTTNAIAGSSSHYANRIVYLNSSQLQHQQRNSRNIQVPISDFDAATVFTLVCGDNDDYFTVNGVAGTYASNGGNTTSGNFYIGVYAKTFNTTPGIFNAHKFNIYTGSTKVRQYYPAKRASDGVCSLYDYLNGRFEANPGTGTITENNTIPTPSTP